MAIADRSAAPVGRREAEVTENKTPVVKGLAWAGAAIVALFGYIVISWVTGPYFEKVPQGPSNPPGWMQVELLLWQIFSIPAALFCIYRFIVRPWRREKTVGVDGVLVAAFATMWVQDVFSSAGNHWFVYNTSMLNFGSWANSIPWWTSYGEPGAMTSEPILFTPAAYVYIMVIGAVCGCWAMRRYKAWRPQTTSGMLIIVCFAAMCVFDIVLEGLIWLPLGVFEYPGGHWSIFPDSYHKYPLNEMLTIAGTFTVVACLRYFVDDKGLTVAERGVDKMRLSPGRKVMVRMLAVIAVVNIGFFMTYGLPNTFIGLNSTEWPQDLQKRSYFLNGLCGVPTDRACPGPNNPAQRDVAPYVNSNGGVTIQSEREGGGPVPAPLTPLDKGDPGGSE
jgi:hypothetical protein